MESCDDDDLTTTSTSGTLFKKKRWNIEIWLQKQQQRDFIYAWANDAYFVEQRTDAKRVLAAVNY